MDFDAVLPVVSSRLSRCRDRVGLFGERLGVRSWQAVSQTGLEPLLDRRLGLKE